MRVPGLMRVACVLALGTLGLSACGGDASEIGSREGGNSNTSASADRHMPTRLTCSGRTRVSLSGELDKTAAGESSAEELVEKASTPQAPLVLSKDGRAAFELRPDGTAWKRRTIVEGSRGFIFAGSESCSPR